MKGFDPKSLDLMDDEENQDPYLEIYCRAEDGCWTQTERFTRERAPEAIENRRGESEENSCFR